MGILRTKTRDIATPIDDLRMRLEYVALRALSGLLRLLPIDAAASTSAAAWRILGPRLMKKRHERALTNLRLAFPDATEAERRAICLAHWENFGRVLVETMLIDRVVADPARIEIRNETLMARYRGKLGAAIGVSLHLGNWELAIWPLTSIGADPAAVYRSIKNPYVDRYLKHLRKHLYPSGLFGRGNEEHEDWSDRKTARVITDFVRRGGRLGIVCDQHYGRGIAVPFFSRPTRTQPIAAIIARRTGARVWMARCVRLGKQTRFAIDIREVRVPRTANVGQDIRQIQAEILSQFEVWIRENPGQWMWSNRIW